MGQFCVLHMESRAEVSSILERHIVRQEIQYVNGVRVETVWVPDNADVSKVHLNRELVSREVTDPSTGKAKTLTIQQAVNRRIEEAGIKKVRSNQNTCIEVVFSGSPETMCAMSQEQVNAWARDTLAWAQDRWGKENIVSATLHCDEKTPHMHVIVVPIVQGQSRRTASKERLDAAKGVETRRYKTDTTRNRLCANEVYTQPRLYEYHTSYAEAVGEKYGLSRGIRAELGSHKRHTSSIEYNRMLAQEAAEKERLISDLTHDYKEQKEKLQSLDKEITENRSKILSQKQESTALGAQLDWMNHSITTQAQTLESLTSHGLLHLINELPAHINRELQSRVERYWRGTVISHSLYKDLVNYEEFAFVRVNMKGEDSVPYYIEVRLMDGMVWLDGEADHVKNRAGQPMLMKELAQFFTNEMTHEARMLLRSISFNPVEERERLSQQESQSQSRGMRVK